MTSLEKIEIDRDLMILDEIVEDGSLPERNWDAIVNLYNQTNKAFPIPPLVCAKILQKIKEGQIPRTVFKERGISYINFMNRYTKSKTVIEETLSKGSVTEDEWRTVLICKNDPAFLLGQDIERVRAFHFNKSMDDLREKAEYGKFENWLEYMHKVHSEEFEEKKDSKGVEITINFAPGLLESL